MHKEISSLLRTRGFKVTPQRLAIYQVLAATKEHPSAEMIYQKLQPAHPTMSLATVYKTVEMLREVDLLQVLNVGEDSFRYDANVRSHPHIVCLQCRRVDDIPEMDHSELVDDAAAKSGYDIIGQQFYFYGYCPECRKVKELEQ